MSKTIIRVLVVSLALISASFAVNVSVSSPYSGATVASPTTIKASATGAGMITGWRIYVDSKSVYQAGASSSISAPISMGLGTHNVIVRAWDATGAYASYALQLKVGSSSPSTTPGSNTGVTVTVASPSNGATVASPATISASANSGTSITGWRVYVDGNSVYSAGAQSSISAPVSLTPGSREIIVRAWNASGAYGSASLSLNVGGSTTPGTNPGTTPNDGGPVPPSHAIVYNKVDELTNWGSCATYDCSGSSQPASYWMAPFQTTPSLDGASARYQMSGSSWSNVLWWKSVGPANNATKFLLDFWVKPSPETLNHAEAMEYDFVQSVNGRKWDFSNQCHYSGQHWDTWDGLTLKWVHTNIPCQKLDPNKWHHIKIFAERVGTKTHNISYTVNGVTHQVPEQYAWHETRATDWANAVVVQVQMDINKNPGTISENIDKMTLYAW